MASIGSAFPSTTTPSSTPQTPASSGAGSGSSSLSNQATFLQLLVAQLKNQDPEQPVQGTEFVTQLATFSNVEQSLAVRQDVDAISSKFLGSVPSGGTVSTPADSGTTATGATGSDSASGSSTTP